MSTPGISPSKLSRIRSGLLEILPPTPTTLRRGVVHSRSVQEVGRYIRYHVNVGAGRALVEDLAAGAGVDVDTSARAIDLMLRAIEGSLIAGEGVCMPGVGVLRARRNPQRRWTISLITDRDLNHAVNRKPYSTDLANSG